MFITIPGKGLVTFSAENYHAKLTSDSGTHTEGLPALPVHYQHPITPTPHPFYQLPPPYLNAIRPQLHAPVPRTPVHGQFKYSPTQPPISVNFNHPLNQLLVPGPLIIIILLHSPQIQNNITSTNSPTDQIVYLFNQNRHRPLTTPVTINLYGCRDE